MAKQALCVGINDYPGTGSDLAGCVNDANDWAKTLTSRGFTVSKMFDKQATGKAMRKAFADIVGGAKRGDTVVIQYSGHGSYVPDQDGDEPDGTDECLCPYDIGSNGPITDDELFDIYMNRERGVKLVIISDSCHSGTVAKFAPAATGKQERRVRFLPPQAFLSRRDFAKLGMRRAIRRSSPPGRYAALLMAGCQDTEYSYDAHFQGRANGAFTFAALGALKNLPANATYRDWFKAVRQVLPSQQYPQSPNLYGSTSMKRWKVLA